MSTDNIIYIQQRLDGVWWIWEQSVSSETSPAPDYYQKSRENALIKAHNWQKELNTKYGVHECGAQKTTAEQSPVTGKIEVRLRISPSSALVLGDHLTALTEESEILKAGYVRMDDVIKIVNDLDGEGTEHIGFAQRILERVRELK